jgi:putative Mn2+ efflux pump MntP
MVADTASTLALAIGVGAAIGVDNMRASAGLGLITPVRRQHLVLASLIAADAIALLAGAFVGAALPAAIDRVAGLFGLAILVALAIVGLVGSSDDRLATVAERREVAIGLPVLLSVDNFAAGAALSALGHPIVPTIPVAATVGAALCLLGFAAGGWLRSFDWVMRLRLGGVLMSIAVVAALLEVR